MRAIVRISGDLATHNVYLPVLFLTALCNLMLASRIGPNIIMNLMIVILLLSVYSLLGVMLDG